ncbi:MAG TPA: serine--tRNA ligase [Candidatus Sumerlaeota bacterium]|nr:serine--tRNA ligase [Candidatus Sumerlaeota bacterium]
MLDIQLFRNEPERVARGFAAKGINPAEVDRVLELDAKRRDCTFQTEVLKKERNEASKQVGKIVKEGGDAEPIKERMRIVGDEIKRLDDELKQANEDLQNLLLRLPNLPHESAPVGRTEEDNVVVGHWGRKPVFDFEPKAHWDLGAALDILDLERGARLSGSGFMVLKGKGARLQRALINYMLDLHVEQHGYTEARVPYLVNRATMTGTGQLPKMEEDMYLAVEDDLFLIPTAEVPVTNFHAGEILSGAELPKTYVCYSPCFRREAGAAGKETRGMSRVHQFDKVEMVRTVLPEESYQEIEILRGHAEAVLQSLGLCYRILSLCSGDMSFAAAKCYDLEVWAPGMDRYLEVSSCSNFEDFQARRAGIRFRREAGSKPEFVHTLNASGVALPRLMIALMECGQQADGTIALPEPLWPYMGCQKIG